MEIFQWESLQSLWNAFFWQEENVSTWIIARTVICALALFNAWLLFVDRQMLYSCDEGFGIRTKRDPHTIPPWPRFCIWDYLPEHRNTTTLLVGGYVLSCFCGLIGVFAVWPFVCMFVFDVSRIHRNIMCNHAGDTYIRLITFLIMMAYFLNPLANAGGLDYYLANGNLGIDVDWSPWPIRCVMLLWVSCYVNAGIHKLKGAFWRNGTASFYPLYCNGFRRFNVPVFLLSAPFVKLGTWGTMCVESTAFFALVPDLRAYVVWQIVLMHLVFDYCLNIQLFGWFMIGGCAFWIFPETAHSILSFLL